MTYDGKRYLDAIGSWWVNLFGHSNNRINAAVREQLDKMEHVMLAGFTHEPVVELSERLSGLVSGRLGHCFYSSDGASATEIALKMSFQYWRNGGRPDKTRFVSVQNGYHGETLGALSVTGVELFTNAYAPLLRPVCRSGPLTGALHPRENPRRSVRYARPPYLDPISRTSCRNRGVHSRAARPGGYGYGNASPGLSKTGKRNLRPA